MNRRKFINAGSLTGLSLISWSVVSCVKNNSKTENARNTVKSFQLHEVTIEALQQKMQSGALSSKSITQLYLDRIDQNNRKGAGINAVIEVNPDAITIAESLDKERKYGKIRGPLHGIPILIKDNIDTADKMQTTAGSIALEGNIAKKDSFIVTQLRNAGAVILGKTNLSEFANFRSTRSVSGWSSRGGQTKNPYVLDRSPCGSSSGSAVAVAANLCAVSVGTETNGSIACPASMNAVVGIKPTVGLVSRTGIIPISITQDTAGPFARTVTDAALLLNVLSANDPKDIAAKGHNDIKKIDYTTFLNPDGLRGKRIGVEKSFLRKHEGIDNLLKNALADLKRQGTIIVELDYMQINDVGDAEGIVLRYEFKDGINKYLATANAKVKNLQEIIDFNKKNDAKAMPTFKQETLESAQAKGGLDEKTYQEALAKIVAVRKLMDDMLKKNNLDAVCGPATGPSWCIDPVNGDFWTGYGAYGPSALAGYPSVTVPMGNVTEIPVGLSFLGKAFNESGLIEIAFAYEQASKRRTEPKFIQSLGA